MCLDSPNEIVPRVLYSGVIPKNRDALFWLLKNQPLPVAAKKREIG
jgi:hypothetical protein